MGQDRSCCRGRDVGGPDILSDRIPNVPVPAVLYSGRFDDADLAGRRQSFRLEVCLRLQPLLPAVFTTSVFRAHLRLGAGARRCRCIPDTRKTTRSITSSASWDCPATPFKCSKGCSSSMACRSCGRGWRMSKVANRAGRGIGNRTEALARNTSERRELRDARLRRQRLLRQHECLQGPGWPHLRAGR